MMSRTGVIATLLLGTSGIGSAAELDFFRDVFPFLKVNCISCHNKTTTKADLNMETPELMKQGGESGPGLVPGNGTESLVVQAALHQHDMEMPPENNKSGAVKLTEAEVTIFQQWIDEGAKKSVAVKRTVEWKPVAAGVHPIYTVALTKDGRYAACGRSNRLFLYDLATRQLVTEFIDPMVKGGGAHRAMLQSLAFNEEGDRLASGSFREVKVWHLEKATQPSVQEVPVPTAPVSATLLEKIQTNAKVALTSHASSTDGRRVVTGCSDGTVRVWSASDAKSIAELRGRYSLVRQIDDLEWTEARQTLEQAFQKSEVTRITAQDTALDVLLKKADEAIVAMKKVLPDRQKAVKPADDAVVAAEKTVDELQAEVDASEAGKARVEAVKKLKAAEDKWITAKVKARDARAAVAAAEGNVKDAEAETVRITKTKAANAKALAAANEAISESKKIQDQAKADLAAAKAAMAKPDGKPLAVAFSADDQAVVAAFDDGTLRVWAVASGLPIKEIQLDAPLTRVTARHASPPPQWALEHTLGGDAQPDLLVDRVSAVRFSPDGTLLATGGGELSRSGDVIVFDVASGKPVKTWKERHDDAVLSLDFSPDGKWLASGASDQIAKITEVETGKHVFGLEGHTHHVTGVAFRADGRVLATSGADGVVMSWNLLLGERKKKITGWTKEVTSAQFLGATDQILTSAGDRLVRVVTDEGKQVRAISGLPDFMQSAAGTHDASVLIAGGEDSVLRVWDGTSGMEIIAFEAR